MDEGESRRIVAAGNKNNKGGCIGQIYRQGEHGEVRNHHGGGQASRYDQARNQTRSQGDRRQAGTCQGSGFKAGKGGRSAEVRGPSEQAGRQAGSEIRSEASRIQASNREDRSRSGQAKGGSAKACCSKASGIKACGHEARNQDRSQAKSHSAESGCKGRSGQGEKRRQTCRIEDRGIGACGRRTGKRC
ncbi:hypothetical protein [Aminobacter sp. SS-2016]|uniref:hypothetical protein n=1 Tax=Aminobacter sp. Y103A TaxID=1870862 RepID=UPI00257483E0|nr:hypothetical protein [Aminobacter sp. SS-2016]